MRFNKQELTTLATQPSQKFDKEGVLFLRERQEGFFRRTESEFELRSTDFFEESLYNHFCNIITLYRGEGFVSNYVCVMI